MQNHDAVKNPSHYTEGRSYEPKDVIRDWGLNFNLGNAVKYIARAGRKDDIVQDLKKAQEYIQFEIDAIEMERDIENAQSVVEMLRNSKLHNTEMECSFNPIYKEDEMDSYDDLQVIEVLVPAGANPEDIINGVIAQLYGGEWYENRRGRF